jgi:AcrR family transcriptional regulator
MTPPATSPTRTLSTADERREAVIEAAMRLFAQTGMHTSTLAVAKAAGISQAYLFRLFPHKDDLVVAVARRCHDRIHDTFAAVIARATQAGEDPLEAMGASYVELMGDRELLTLQLHAQAAASSTRPCGDRLPRGLPPPRGPRSTSARRPGRGDQALHGPTECSST